MDFGILFKRAGKAAAENSPAILTAIGVTGTIATAYFAAKGAFKAAEIIQEETDQRVMAAGGINGDVDVLTTKEKADLTWKCYIPAAASAAMTVASIICAVRVQDRRNAAIASAYSVVEKSYAEYRAKTIEKTTKKKEQEIRDEVAQDRVNANPVNQTTIVVTTKGNTLCYDMWTDRYFTSDMELLRKAVNDFNAQVINDNYASLSDFYHLIGLPSTSESDNIGWSTDKLLEIDYSGILDNNGTPGLAMDFRVKPMTRFASAF
jgi:hypothetical protein